MIASNHDMIDICLMYALSKMNEEILNEILKRELDETSKKDIILNLDSTHKLHILKNIGFDEKLLTTI
jgi:hypothetical protein